MSNTPNFEEEKLTERDHLDPDKHWIGEALPAPSIKETQTGGLTNSPGDSPFPARADHHHGTDSIWGQYGGFVQNIPNTGNTFYNQISFTNGQNWLDSGGTSTQLIIFPMDGIYLIRSNWQVNRSGGTAFLASEWYVLENVYGSGGTPRSVSISVYPVGIGQYRLNVVDTLVSIGAQNLQFRITNGAAAVVQWQLASLFVTRLSSYIQGS